MESGRLVFGRNPASWHGMTRIPCGRLRLGQVGFDVDIDLGLSAKGRFEILFHMGGDVVSFDNRRTGIDLDVHVDNERVAVFAGAQVVESLDAWRLFYLLFDGGLDFFGERDFEQFLYAGTGQFAGYGYDKYSHDDRGDGVEYAPAFAQEHGARDTDEGAYRREGVRPVVPAVGNDGGTVDFASHNDGIPIEPLFHDYRDGGHDEGRVGGPLDDAPVEHLVYLHAARVEDADGYDEEGKADEHGGKGLEFAVSVGVAAVFVLGRDFDKDDDDEVGHEIGERVYAVGYHGAASPHDTGCYFGGREYEVDKESYPSDPGSFSLPVDVGDEVGFVHCSMIKTVQI